ncbi:hypothetical protein [Phormidium tenue]|uniref:Uncharacterized protein n=1 Tax=Phormidium tenue NIES-30 TaxID=549789 RepID=A0A1U7IZ82_9CYAN|nr:hypothetical protein [Phormidium tenue]MBD2234607.1 hypothetical protein [Phormidium tenue FACHB-1052]OKH44205.1 hypothetical protein NIES30_23180 [Phormidium tenue NIES-30]
MSQDRSDRVKFIYNAQFPAATAVVLNYLLNNPHFTGRQGRQQGMDAMMAFYRPLAEEFHGQLSVSEIQEMARHCVERLAKQIADLCDRYHIANPVMANVGASAPLGSTARLEAILEELVVVVRGGGAIAPPSPIPASVDIEKGVAMDGDELGDLGDILKD